MALDTRVTQTSVTTLCTSLTSRVTQLSATALTRPFILLTQVTQLSATALTTTLLTNVTQLSATALTKLRTLIPHHFTRIPPKPGEHISSPNHHPHLRI